MHRWTHSAGVAAGRLRPQQDLASQHRLHTAITRQCVQGQEEKVSREEDEAASQTTTNLVDGERLSLHERHDGLVAQRSKLGQRQRARDVGVQEG
jgi:hypothetical protein